MRSPTRVAAGSSWPTWSFTPRSGASPTRRSAWSAWPGRSRNTWASDSGVEQVAEAARLAKIDLVTGTVGEFPELQGKVGGLMLAEEGAPAAVAHAVYAHYQPVGPEDSIPPTDEGRVVAVSDKLDSVVRLIGAGEVPSGSRDPFALRRATSGVLRIAVEGNWPISRNRSWLRERSRNMFWKP